MNVARSKVLRAAGVTDPVALAIGAIATAGTLYPTKILRYQFIRRKMIFLLRCHDRYRALRLRVLPRRFRCLMWPIKNIGGPHNLTVKNIDGIICELCYS
jgi:hypothetical protein